MTTMSPPASTRRSGKSPSGPGPWGFVCLCLAFVLAMAPPAEAKKHKLSRDEMTLFTLLANDPLQAREKMKLDPILCVVARKRAREMARKNEFSHIDSKGNGPNQRVLKAGYQLPAIYERAKTANNVASIVRTTGSSKYAVKVWKSSEGHKIHIFGQYDFYRMQPCVGIGSALSKSGERFCVFLSAHPNVSKKPPRVILLDPKGKVIASTRKRVVIRPTL